MNTYHNFTGHEDSALSISAMNEDNSYTPVLQDTLNAHWHGTKHSSIGYKMLQKMGWSEDKGLGRLENGITNHVKLKKRETALGLGMEDVIDDGVGSKAWNSTVASFNGVLEMLKSQYQPDANDGEKKKKKKKRKIEDVTDAKDSTKKRAIVSVGIK